MQTGMSHGMEEAPDPPSKHMEWEHEEPAEVGYSYLHPSTAAEQRDLLLRSDHGVKSCPLARVRAFPSRTFL